MGSNRMKNSDFYDMFEYRTEKRKKEGQTKTRLIFLVICGFRLFKETAFEFPKGFSFFFLFFLSSSGQLRVCWLLENPGDFEKENLWWLMIKWNYAN